MDAGAIAGIATAAAAAIGSAVSAFKTNSSKGAGFSQAGGQALVGNISKFGTPSNFDWTKIKDLFKGIEYNLGDYAASAFDYYMSDRAFQKQVDYNFDAMAKQYEYDKAMLGHSYNYSKALTGSQQDWQEMMSNTSHQREVADLRSAGLNPILSSNAGANAYSASGQVISGSAPGSLGVDQPNYQGASSNRIARQQMRIAEKTANAQQNLMAAQALEHLGNLNVQDAQVKRMEAQTGNDFFNSLNAAKKSNAEVAKLESERSKLDWSLVNELPAVIENLRASSGAHNAAAASHRSQAGYYGHLDLLLGDGKSSGKGDTIKVGPFSYSHSENSQRY